MTAQALTLPVTRISVPALLLAAAGTAAVVSLGVALLDERTVVEQTVPASTTSTQTGTADPMGAYVDSLIARHDAYERSQRQQ